MVFFFIFVSFLFIFSPPFFFYPILKGTYTIHNIDQCRVICLGLYTKH